MSVGTASLDSQVLDLLRSEIRMDLEVDTDVIESGLLDSLTFVDLLLRLEEEFGLRIRVEELDFDDFRSATAVARFIERQQPTG